MQPWAQSPKDASPSSSYRPEINWTIGDYVYPPGTNTHPNDMHGDIHQQHGYHAPPDMSRRHEQQHYAYPPSQPSTETPQHHGGAVAQVGQVPGVQSSSASLSSVPPQPPSSSQTAPSNGGPQPPQPQVQPQQAPPPPPPHLHPQQQPHSHQPQQHHHQLQHPQQHMQHGQHPQHPQQQQHAQQIGQQQMPQQQMSQPQMAQPQMPPQQLPPQLPQLSQPPPAQPSQQAQPTQASQSAQASATSTPAAPITAASRPRKRPAPNGSNGQTSNGIPSPAHAVAPTTHMAPVATPISEAAVHGALNAAAGLPVSAELDGAPPPSKKSRTNTPWTPEEEHRLKDMRDDGKTWAEIAKAFPTRTEGSVKKHWYKDMHYAEFAKDEVRELSYSESLLQAIKEYDANKWKSIGQKLGKPAKACEQYAKEHFPQMFANSQKR